MKELLERIKRLRLLVVGDVMLDKYLRGDVSRISPEAPVPVLLVDGEHSVAGGAANVALNVAALGAEVEACGFFGKDEAGETLRGILDEAGVSCGESFACSAAPTICKTRLMAGNQQICRMDWEESSGSYQPDLQSFADSLAEKAKAVDAVIVSDYGKGFITDDLLVLLRREAEFLAIDPKPRRKVSYSSPDLMTPNKTESLQLAGLDKADFSDFPEEAVTEAIVEGHKPRLLAITLGGDGMLLAEDGKVLRRIPTAAREVFDVSGAGDTVIAALTLALAAGASFEESAAFANVAAGVVVGKVGTACASPEEIVAAISES